MMSRVAARQNGFSLLELLVAFAIVAIALGMLYKVSGASARSVGDAQRYQRAVFLVNSLLDSSDSVHPEGWNANGQSGDYQWVVRSMPFPTDIQRASPTAIELHQLTLVVSWAEQGTTKRIEVNTLRPQRKPAPLTGGRP